MRKCFKYYCRKVCKNIFAGGCFALAVSSFAACGKLFDDNSDCVPVYQVRFVYDMNMSGGDAFPSQVESVCLWVFKHSTGEFVDMFSDSGEALSAKDYTLSLDRLSPGEYDFIAWCGLENSTSFTMPSAASVRNMSDLKCSLATTVRDGGPVSDALLAPLFYGSLYAQTIPADYGIYTYTVYLMKDTNNINLSLQHLSAEVLKESDFSIYMIVDNANLDYDNSVIPSQAVCYSPWIVRSGAMDLQGEDMNLLQAEISTSRLMADTNPQIVIIENDTRNIVYAIPIVEWAKKLRSVQNLGMDDQEYLDREHEYTIMVQLLDTETGWKAASIIINGYEMTD